MTITDILEEMKVLLSRRADVKREIERLQRAGNGYQRPVINGMPKGTPLHPETIEVAEHLAALMEELKELEIDLSTFRRRLEPAINSLPDGPQKMMLRLRYVPIGCLLHKRQKKWDTTGNTAINCLKRGRNHSRLFDKKSDNMRQDTMIDSVKMLCYAILGKVSEDGTNRGRPF